MMDYRAELLIISWSHEWQDSLTQKKGSMSFSEGGFLLNFIETPQYWYNRGIRIYKFDFVDFGTATPETARKKTPEEIRAANVSAFREALLSRRRIAKGSPLNYERTANGNRTGGTALRELGLGVKFSGTVLRSAT